jgi:hypothetical protein
LLTKLSVMMVVMAELDGGGGVGGVFEVFF